MFQSIGTERSEEKNSLERARSPEVGGALAREGERILRVAADLARN